MNNASLLALALVLPTAAAIAAETHVDLGPEFARCLSPDAKLTRLATDLGFLEGPVWIKDSSSLVFSDIPNDELKMWSANGGLTTFRKPSRNANGNAVDSRGRLFTCEHTGRRVSVQEKDGTVKTLVDTFEGRKLNSPNDVVVRSDGTVWFTDPEY